MNGDNLCVLKSTDLSLLYSPTSQDAAQKLSDVAVLSHI